MFRQPGATVALGSLPEWSLLFAREPEPEPDLDLDEGTAESDKTVMMDSGKASGDPGKSGSRRPLVLVLLLLVVGAGVYVGTDPDTLTSLLGSGADAPPAAPIPAPKRPAMPPVPAAPKPAPAVPTPAMPADTKPASAVTVAPSPLFGEGQRVSVAADSASPTSPVLLSGDAGGTKPGPAVIPGTSVTVVDGELRSNVWFYAVRTQQGATGWIAETRLRPAKP
ncbi:MAG: hypothetical protein AB1411_12425 [Nitrospirota bacterium]